MNNLKRVIRRNELRRMIPLADSTIYVLEKKGEFPQRFYLSPRCVAWDLEEIEAWIAERRATTDPDAQRIGPDVRLRRTRPVRA